MAISTRLFDTFMQPLEVAGLSRLRMAVVSRARGHVLEVGAGSGLNAPYYRFDHVTHLTVTDKEADRPVLMRSLRRAHAPYARTTVLNADATQLPFADGSFDSVVCTLVLCSVPSVKTAVNELRRVLRPGGVLHFIEHVHPPRAALRPVFDAVTPGWRRVAAGCHLNRDTPAWLTRQGFRLKLTSSSINGVLVSGCAF